MVSIYLVINARLDVNAFAALLASKKDSVHGFSTSFLKIAVHGNKKRRPEKQVLNIRAFFLSKRGHLWYTI